MKRMLSLKGWEKKDIKRKSNQASAAWNSHARQVHSFIQRVKYKHQKFLMEDWHHATSRIEFQNWPRMHERLCVCVYFRRIYHSLVASFANIRAAADIGLFRRPYSVQRRCHSIKFRTGRNIVILFFR